MSDKYNERLEREARESLVAADLSAKMKSWQTTPPPRKPGGKGWMLLLLLAFGGAAWWLWPNADVPQPEPSPKTYPAPDAPTPAAPDPVVPAQQKPQPMAEKPKTNRYLALTASNYRAPDFASEVRGNTPDVKDPLDDARRALADKRPADALKQLLTVPAGYETDAKYLRAHALFELKKYTEAASLFAQLNSSIRYGEAAQWYEVLASLPNYDRYKSRIDDNLKRMAADNSHTFQQEAKTLQVQLNPL